MDAPRTAEDDGRANLSRWNRLPGWLQGALTVVATLGSIIVVTGVEQSLPDAWKPWWWLAVLVAIAGVLAWILRYARARAGGRDQHALFRKALRTGTVPAGADRDRWRTFVDEQRRGRSGVWWFYGFFGLFVAAVNVQSALTSDLPPGVTALLLVLAIGLGVGLWVGVPALIVRRQNRRLDALREQLDSAPPA